MKVDIAEGRKLLAAATKGPRGYLDGLVRVDVLCYAHGEFTGLGDDFGRIEEPVELSYVAWAANNAEAMMAELERFRAMRTGL